VVEAEEMFGVLEARVAKRKSTGVIAYVLGSTVDFTKGDRLSLRDY